MQPAAGRKAEAIRVILVTGPSGAGRSTATRALEDLGYEVIDNIPLTLLPRLFKGPPLERPLALGIDCRTRDFDVGNLLAAAEVMRAETSFDFTLLYLDCAPDVLLRRFSETRRRHPFRNAATPALGIEMERRLLEPVRDAADILIDTTGFNPHDLKAEIGRWFALTTDARMRIAVTSFSYKRGVPAGMDLVLDCRFLRNPHWEPALRPLDGRAPQVADHVRMDPRWQPFWKGLLDLLDLLLPGYAEEGKSHLAIGIGCSGGQHRSVMVAESLAKTLAEMGWPVSKRHLELERRGAAPGRPTGDDQE